MRLIDGDELLLRFIPRGGDNPFTRFVRETVRLRIEEMPTIEAEQVKHGKWIRDAENFGKYYCSECGFSFIPIGVPKDNYCSNCGSDNREVKNES